MQGEDDLTPQEIEAIFRQIGRLDAVRLTGGEPFIRKDLLCILELVERYLRPIVVHITTNGFLSDRIVDLCERRDRGTPLQLMVSLDGLEGTHNRIRGSSVAWKTAMTTIESLAGRTRELNLDLVVNQTIVDRDGLQDYRAIREILRPLGVRHQAVMAYDTSATYNVETEIDVAPSQIGEFATRGKFDADELKDFLAEIEIDLATLPKPARLAKSYYWTGIKQRLLPQTVTEYLNPPCVALHSHLRIFPNGDVPTCQFNSKTVGNLRKQSFQDIWSSSLADQQRDWVRKCAGCWAECEILPNAIYTLDLLRPKVKRVETRVSHPEPATDGGSMPEACAPPVFQIIHKSPALQKLP